MRLCCWRGFAKADASATCGVSLTPELQPCEKQPKDAHPPPGRLNELLRKLNVISNQSDADPAHRAALLTRAVAAFDGLPYISLVLLSGSNSYTQIAGWSEDPCALSIGIPQPVLDSNWACSIMRVASIQAPLACCVLEDGRVLQSSPLPILANHSNASTLWTAPSNTARHTRSSGYSRYTPHSGGGATCAALTYSTGPEPSPPTLPAGVQPTSLRSDTSATCLISTQPAAGLPADWAWLASHFGYSSFVAVPVLGSGSNAIVGVLVAADKGPDAQLVVTSPVQLHPQQPSQPVSTGDYATAAVAVAGHSKPEPAGAGLIMNVANMGKLVGARGRFADEAWISQIESIGLWLGQAVLQDGWLTKVADVIDALSEAACLEELARVLVGSLSALVSQRLHTRLLARVALVRPGGESAMVFEEMLQGTSHEGQVSNSTALLHGQGNGTGAGTSQAHTLSHNPSHLTSSLAAEVACVALASNERSCLAVAAQEQAATDGNHRLRRPSRPSNQPQAGERSSTACLASPHNILLRSAPDLVTAGSLPTPFNRGSALISKRGAGTCIITSSSFSGKPGGSPHGRVPLASGVLGHALLLENTLLGEAVSDVGRTVPDCTAFMCDPDNPSKDVLLSVGSGGNTVPASMVVTSLKCSSAFGGGPFLGAYLCSPAYLPADTLHATLVQLDATLQQLRPVLEAQLLAPQAPLAHEYSMLIKTALDPAKTTSRTPHLHTPSQPHISAYPDPPQPQLRGIIAGKLQGPGGDGINEPGAQPGAWPGAGRGRPWPASGVRQQPAVEQLGPLQLRHKQSIAVDAAHARPVTLESRVLRSHSHDALEPPTPSMAQAAAMPLEASPAAQHSNRSGLSKAKNLSFSFVQAVRNPRRRLVPLVVGFQDKLRVIRQSSVEVDAVAAAGRTQCVAMSPHGTGPFCLSDLSIVDIIGHGGFGSVYLGQLQGLDVAVKVIYDEVAAASPPASPRPIQGMGSPGARPDAQQGVGKGAAAGDEITASGPHGGDKEPMYMISMSAVTAPAARASGAGSAQDLAARAMRVNEMREALELAILSTVSHPNILQVHCYFTDVLAWDPRKQQATGSNSIGAGMGVGSLPGHSSRMLWAQPELPPLMLVPVGCSEPVCNVQQTTPDASTTSNSTLRFVLHERGAHEAEPGFQLDGSTKGGVSQRLGTGDLATPMSTPQGAMGVARSQLSSPTRTPRPLPLAPTTLTIGPGTSPTSGQLNGLSLMTFTDAGRVVAGKEAGAQQAAHAGTHTLIDAAASSATEPGTGSQRLRADSGDAHVQAGHVSSETDHTDVSQVLPLHNITLAHKAVGVDGGSRPLLGPQAPLMGLLHQAMASGSAAGWEAAAGSVGSQAMPRPPPDARRALVIVMELCDLGSLADALRAQVFLHPAAAAAPPGLSHAAAGGPAFLLNTTSNDWGHTWVGPRMQPDMLAVYTTLLEVGAALCHLHSHYLVHCDVKAANILLRSSYTDARGFTTRLSDFGLTRLVATADDTAAPRAGARHRHSGTVTHMPPELLRVPPGQVTTAADIYAFGILMWEVFTSAPVYLGMVAEEIRRRVGGAAGGAATLRPRFPPSTPRTYVELAERCWADDPEVRPSAEEVVGAVKNAIRALRSHLHGHAAPTSLARISVDQSSPRAVPATVAAAHRRLTGARRSVSHSTLLQQQMPRLGAGGAKPTLFGLVLGQQQQHSLQRPQQLLIPGSGGHPGYAVVGNTSPRSPLANPSRIYYQQLQGQPEALPPQ